MKKKFIKDSLINIVSAALPLMVLQIISMPLIAKQEGATDYGLVVVVISILTLFSFPFGNVLNNVRLLKEEFYEKKRLEGDFASILFGSSLVSVVMLIVVSYIFFENQTIINIIFQVIIVLGLLLKEYWVVAYRINLNFKGILLNNFILSIGYLVGTGLYYLIGFWEVIYISGLCLSLVYIMYNTRIWKESLSLTKEFKFTFLDFLTLYFSGVLKNILLYADKILLLPLLGPTNVAIYFSATIIGKIISMMFTPINSVILGYIRKLDRISNKILLKVFIIVMLFTVISYSFTIIVSPKILYILYPEWAEESLKLIYITTAAIYISIISSLFQPFNLRYNKIKWQIYINGSNLLLYIFTAIYFTDKYELMGFAISVLLSNIYLFTFQLIVFLTQRN